MNHTNSTDQKLINAVADLWAEMGGDCDEFLRNVSDLFVAIENRLAQKTLDQVCNVFCSTE